MRVPVSHLARERRARGLTQEELGRLTGVSAGAICALENRATRSWPRIRRALCRVLAMEKRELFGRDQFAKPLPSPEHPAMREPDAPRP